MSCAFDNWKKKHGPAKPDVLTGAINHRFVTVDNLPGEKKQQLWAGIKNKEPALAELMQDATFLQFKKQFGAVQKVEVKTYNQLIEVTNGN
ncbi:MAG: hypothetical protein OEX07_03305 [Gammaproteobacteria bacterium]|nr:hypothetical protein [Gammaproteobacteria bacterium]